VTIQNKGCQLLKNPLILTCKGRFIWDDSKEELDFSNWDEGQPDNWYDEGEDCVSLYSSGAWNDLGCYTVFIGDDDMRAICQDFQSSIIP